MNTLSTTVVAGIDVGKSKLDAHLLHAKHDRQFNNDKAGRRILRDWLRQNGVQRAVFEPTGRYHRPLHQCLFDSGMETVLVNPLRSRRFAEAIGNFAKTDRVDAAMLARFGTLDNLTGSSPAPQQLQRLSDLLAVRRQLLKHLDALRKLQSELGTDSAVPMKALTALQEDIDNCDRAMRACVASDDELSRRASIIESIPGLGPVNAASLCADMPELGTLGRRQAASLLGVAPFASDSGGHHGRRAIRGGRAEPRRLLYMAAMSARIWEPGSKSLYNRLVARGKHHKVAMVAVMRRLIGLVDTLLREDRMWQAEAPSRPMETAA